MAVIKAGLIQMSLKGSVESDSPETIKQKMLDAHMALIEDAARHGVQVLGLQEIFNIPYVCASHDPKWYASAEPIPDGPTTKHMQSTAKELTHRQDR